MSLVSYLPPLPPLLHTSQLTETWQWPTCMCWQPKLTLLVWSQCWDWGKSCLLLLFHSWNFLGLQYCPAPLEQSLPSWDARASPSALWPSWLQVQSSSWPSILWVEPFSLLPEGVVQALLGWTVTLFLSSCKRNRPSAAWWHPTHTCRLATVAFCDSACFAGAGVGVCNLLCITCTVSLSYLSTGCFS